MKLNLKRPLAFFDLETTGTNLGIDRIVEISVIKLNPDGSENVKTWRVNPDMIIPLESSLVHGIYNEDIKNEPLFKEISKDVASFIGEADLAGFNSNKFDIPMLMEEFLRAGEVFDLKGRYFVDVQNIFHQMEQRTLKAAYQFYCGKQIVNAHSAEADARATMEVLQAQIERYQNVAYEDKKGINSYPIVNDIEALHNFTNLNKTVDFAGRMVYDDKGQEIFNFGKHKGKAVEDVLRIEPSYFSWMMQGDFPLYTKRKLQEINDRFNLKKQSEKQPKSGVLKVEEAPVLVKEQIDIKTNNTTVLKEKFVGNSIKKELVNSTNNLNKGGIYPNNKPFKNKNDEPILPVNEDMLKQLADKFKKG